LSNLYIVGTPIGNLEDLTFRALKTLKEVDFIFSEDTRVSRKLLNKYEVHTKLISIYKPNKKLNSDYFLELLNSNDIAFISDAGMPGISDPGGEFVYLARKNDHNIVTIPGVSSLTSAFSVSGIESKGFTFLGFLPKSDKQKINLLSKSNETNLPVIIFESPRRIKSTLEFLKEEFDIQNIFIGKELTKIYETTFYGEINEAINKFSKEKGEFVIIFNHEKIIYSKSLIEKYDKILIEGYEKGIKGKNLLNLISDLSGTNKSLLYERWLEIKRKNGNKS
jgi:16S rRNA (cytidine1402-2'-O)-methyltransferase